MAVMKLSRPDKSGGWVILKYSNGSVTHRARFHVSPFNGADAGLAYVAVSDGGSEVVNTPVPTEAGAVATAAALIAQYQPGLPASWSIGLDSVYKNIGPDPANAGFNLFQELFSYTPPASAAGTNGGTVASAAAPGMYILNFRTTQGGRARFIMIGGAYWSVNGTGLITANAAGTADQKIVAYLSGAATGVVGHDGYKFVPSAHLTMPYNRRLRRHFSLA